MLPPFLSRASANKALGKLKNDGFDDVALLSSGEFENSISVGLFTNHETALGRQKELLEKNYQTLVRERLVTRTNYWLDITGPQQALAARLERLAESGEKLGIASCRSGQISGRE
jgi:phosphoglycolate phosphatase-like HAD superfamily hydrolase